MKRLIGLILIVMTLPALVQADNVKRNESQAVQYATDGDTGPHVAVDRYANQMCSLQAGTASATNPIKLEDAASANGDAGIVALGIVRNTLNSNVSTTDDYGTLGIDAEGKVMVNPYAPSGVTFSSCSSAITGTARTAIKSAVASNRHYITSITCSNNSAVNTQASFTDGAGAQLAAGNITALGGIGFAASFPVPLRGSVNTDVSVTLTTTATNTICCANGYISVN